MILLGEIQIGSKLGHLEIIGIEREDKRGNVWRCKCVCGKEIIAWNSDLIPRPGRRSTKSCGCMKTNRDGKTMTHLRVYSIWAQMKRRCYNPKADNYSRYGAKGTRIADEWLEDFNAFLDWSLENGYKENLTIDRIDSSKNYSPDNCRWVDYYTQIHNRRPSKNSKTGMSGVTLAPNGKFRAAINRKSESFNLGTYEKLEDAKAARLKAEEYFAEHDTFKGFVK